MASTSGSNWVTSLKFAPVRMALMGTPFASTRMCGPFRDDLAKQTQYCGMFLTPTLRNVAERKVFFHNDVYHDLKQVMDFYNLRNTEPEKIYPRDTSGKVQKYNDLPLSITPTSIPPTRRPTASSATSPR
jgi:cytochrome c peroxidase